MRPSLRTAVPLITLASGLLGLSPVAGVAMADETPVILIQGSPLAGAVLVAGSAPTVTATGAHSVKFILDGVYLGVDRTAPFSWPVSAAAGRHELKVRVTTTSGRELRGEAVFTIGTPVTAAPIAPAPASPAGSTTVRTTDGLRSALATARPGSVITLADGEYVFRPRLVASPSGTPSAPITLRGSRSAVIRSTGADGDYGLHITGSYWRVEGLTVAHASKGIVLDRSVGTVLDRVQVHDIGAEGVHFRSCSADSVLRNSLIRETGRTSPQYGEGVYVGSANSNWAGFSCVDGRDNSERVLIEDNVFRNLPAEGADLKEGTDSGVLRRNLFDNTGYSGANSADSAVDAKGNGWLIEGNTVRGASGAFLDGFQTHTVFAGYGSANVFRANRVEGPVKGRGFGLYPTAGNVVACSNTAPGALLGLASVPCS